MRVRRAATSGTPTAPRGRAKAWHSSLCSVRETCRTPVCAARAANVPHSFGMAAEKRPRWYGR